LSGDHRLYMEMTIDKEEDMYLPKRTNIPASR